MRVTSASSSSIRTGFAFLIKLLCKKPTGWSSFQVSVLGGLESNLGFLVKSTGVWVLWLTVYHCVRATNVV